MVRSYTASLRPEVLVSAVAAAREGFVQGATQGDTWQLGGVLLIVPGGDVVWSALSRHAGDHPDIADVITAVANLGAAKP
jgi:hypothetical protein